ncbi:MAG: hypothetical protein ACE5JK_05100, partial [Candidatus Omnitrophota bacterium]
MDDALETYHNGFNGETFIIESNDYGIEGIGTNKLRGVLRPLEKYPLAKFYELAHAFIRNELHEKGESALLDYIISKLVYEGLSGEQALDKYLEKKADKYKITKEEDERKKWKDAWRVHYALRLFQKRYAKKEDEELESVIKSNAPDGIYPPHFPPDHIKFRDSRSKELRGTLPLEMEILDVQRHGPLIEPRGSHEFHLNAGLLAINYMRLLFNRIVIGRPDQKGLRFSKIGLYLHNKNEGKVVKIDENMLLPESRMIARDGEAKDSDLVAYEDPRVIHRRELEEKHGVEAEQGYIYMFLTVVRRDGKYYSAVTRHKEEEFLKNVYKKLEDKNAEVNWEWSKPERLITEGPLAEQNIKNFVPFGNPTNGKWYAKFWPSQDHNSQIWLAETDKKNGLMGPWKVVGPLPYITAALPGFQHLGPSASVAELKLENLPPGLTGFQLDLIHAAALEDNEGGKKKPYYDIRLLLTDRKNPAMKYWSEAFLVPTKGEPYEMEDGKRKLWVPGVIYSCGAILNCEPEYDPKNKSFILNFDVYYSGSDTAVLWATVKVVIKYKKDEEKREALARETKRISGRLHRAEPEKEKKLPREKKPPKEEKPPEEKKPPKDEVDIGQKPEIDHKFPTRNLEDLEQLATSFVEMVTSKALAVEEGQQEPRKLVLAFDKNIDNESALNLIQELKDLKRNPNYRAILQNLEIVIEKTEDLPGELDQYAGKDNATVFVFAPKTSREKLASLEANKNVNAAYMELEDAFEAYHYYPLIEVVTMTLARYLTKDPGYLNRFTVEELNRMNIATKPEEVEEGILIFKLLPRIERYQHDQRLDRYALLRQFIEAA